MSAQTYAMGARTGQEFSVRDDLSEIGVDAWVALEVFPVRPPNTGKVFASERPRWPGYVFAEMDAMQFFESRNIRYLHATKLALYPQEVRVLKSLRASIDAENERIRREIEAGNKLTQFKPGDRLEILDGPFLDRLASFAAIVRKTGRGYALKIELDGFPLPIEIDAASVRKVG